MASSPQPDHTPFYVAFSHVSGIGPVRLAALLDRFGNVEAAWNASRRELAAVLDNRSAAAVVETRRHLDLGRSMKSLVELGAQVLTQDSAQYPARLREIPRPPFVLYVTGSADALSRRSVAVVGTRRASDYGLMAARRLAGGIGDRGVAVVSGMALGIDAAAHRAAVDTSGSTIAVLGCGLDIDYPFANRSLRKSVDSRGAVVTEYPPGTTPLAGNFPARNRIVSGLALATLVVEAGTRSGALITARLALDQGREVFAVPGSIFSERSAGSNGLIAAGAAPALSAGELLEALELESLVPSGTPAPEPRDATQAALLRLLGEGPLHVDDLCRAAGIPASDAARALTLMELRGWVQHMGGMRWMATR
ncbi:MAG: DNA-processing protein DprA [Anaerolineae bacterium]